MRLLENGVRIEAHCPIWKRHKHCTSVSTASACSLPCNETASSRAEGAFRITLPYSVPGGDAGQPVSILASLYLWDIFYYAYTSSKVGK